MRALAVFAALVLAGCAHETEGGAIVVSLDGASPLDVLPDPSILPAGFHIGLALSQKGNFAHMVDGESRVLECNNATERQRLAVGALLFESPDRARDAFRDITRSPPGDSGLAPIAIGDDAFHEEQIHPYEGGGGGSSVTVIARAGSYVVWASHDSRGAPPAVDARDVARAMIARATSPSR